MNQSQCKTGVGVGAGAFLLLAFIALALMIPLADAKSCAGLIQSCFTWTGCRAALGNVLEQCTVVEQMLQLRRPNGYGNANKNNRNQNQNQSPNQYQSGNRPKKSGRRNRNSTTTGAPAITTTAPNGFNCGVISPLCLQAVAALLTVEEDQIGTSLLNCTCDPSEDCDAELIECALKPASRLRYLATDLSKQQSWPCSFAAFYCAADTGCTTAMHISRIECIKSAPERRYSSSGVPECSNTCNHSLNVLLSRDRGRHLRHCLCDASSKTGEMSDSCMFGRLRQTCDALPGDKQHLVLSSHSKPHPQQQQLDAGASNRQAPMIVPLACVLLLNVLFQSDLLYKLDRFDR